MKAGQPFCAGKYTETNLPKGPRGAVINTDRVREVQPLLSLMRDIASAHGGKTPGQVGARVALPEAPSQAIFIHDRAASADTGHAKPWVLDQRQQVE